MYVLSGLMFVSINYSPLFQKSLKNGWEADYPLFIWIVKSDATILA